MKTHEIKTSKGEFVVVDLPSGAKDIKVFHDIDRPYISYSVGVDTHRLYIKEDVELICKLSEATEDDAIKAVDSFELYGGINVGYKNYMEDEPVLDTALDSLHSLLKSKGIDVNNGNWYLFKKV